MGRKKRNKSTPLPRVTNEMKQQQHQNNKRKSNDISPVADQSHQKIANQNATPATNQPHESEGSTPQDHSSEQEKSQNNQNDSQDTTNTSEDTQDSHRLQIDEGDQSITKDLFPDGESVANKL